MYLGSYATGNEYVFLVLDRMTGSTFLIAGSGADIIFAEKK